MSEMLRGRNFAEVHDSLRRLMVLRGQTIHTESWQGRDITKRPDMVTTELLNAHIEIPLHGVSVLKYFRQDIKPNLPWADDHFEERVSGEPMNPGTQWANWPWGKSAATHMAQQIFNHNYMERFWPKYAGQVNVPTRTAEEFAGHCLVDMPTLHGIRTPYGDLGDLVQLLRREPHTRQAYLPIYFPEDTGTPGRKPCTLGYQFIRREDQLHCFYPMRSCDLIRHFADDAYMAVRLMLWIIDKAGWAQTVTPGTLTMHMTSLHCFANDMTELRKLYA